MNEQDINLPLSDGSEDGPKASPETIRVRQGVTGHNVRYVLMFGLMGAVVAMILIGFFAGWL